MSFSLQQSLLLPCDYTTQKFSSGGTPRGQVDVGRLYLGIFSDRAKKKPEIKNCGPSPDRPNCWAKNPAQAWPEWANFGRAVGLGLPKIIQNFTLSLARVSSLAQARLSGQKCGPSLRFRARLPMPRLVEDPRMALLLNPIWDEHDQWGKGLLMLPFL
jgi:hypothetical protein